jgi:YgiT-type zinc finger domain-containing protein
MHREYVVYYTWLGDDLITVPDFPAWICDFCGRREYDVHALNRLSLILSPTAGSATGKRRSVRSRAAPKPKTPRPSQPE